jgi:hypothetical protein
MHAAIRPFLRKSAAFTVACVVALGLLLLLACMLFDQPPSAVIDHGLSWLVTRYGFGGIFLCVLIVLAMVGIMWITFADDKTTFIDPMELDGAQAWKRFLFGHEPVRKRR